MPKLYRRLTQDQRCQIYALRKRGIAQAGIASNMGINQSTISRKLPCNKGLWGCHFYRRKDFQKIRCSARKGVATVMTTCLIARVEALLTAHQWRREKISGILNRGEGSMKVSHENRYRHIWADKRAGRKLYLHLRQRGKKRNKRGAARAGRDLIPRRIGIAKRPAIVDAKRGWVIGGSTILSAQTTKVQSPAWLSVKPN